MGETINPSSGQIEIAEAGVNMQLALLNAEASSANMITHGALVLQDLYNKEMAGVNSIYEYHSKHHTITIFIATGVEKEGNTYTLTGVTLHLKDPGLPPTSVTGTEAQLDYKETDEADAAFKQVMNMEENPLQTNLQGEQGDLQKLSQLQKGIIPFEGAPVQLIEYAIRLMSSNKG